MIQDLEIALRGLARAPSFTAAAIVTLGLGIGGTALVFSLVDSMMLRPRPFGPRSDRLVTLHSTHPTQAEDWDDSEISYADLRDIADEAATLEAVEGFTSRTLSLRGFDESERVLGASVTPGLFRLLGVEAALGRTFREDDGADVGFEQAVLLSDALWRRRFAADPDIVGQTVPINDRAIAVVGVMPPGFRFPERHDLWLPYEGRRDADRGRRALLGLGLLAPGAAPAAVQAELDAIAGRLDARHPETNRAWGLHLMRLRDFFVSAPTRRALGASLGAVAFVLLVGAINVAGLLLARGIGRERELTVRTALGAGRARLVRLLVTEALVLAAIGAFAGVLVAAWGLDALLSSMPEPPPYWVQAGIDGRVLAFVVVLAAATALVAGLLPALRASRVDLMRGLGEGGRAAGATPGHLRLQGLLVAGQVSLSLTVLVGATLLVTSAMRLRVADAGFDPGPLLSLRVYLAGDRYDPNEAKYQAFADIETRLRAVPGVVSAAFTGAIPADDGGQTVRAVPERGPAAPGEELGLQLLPAMPAFWDTLGLSLQEGRAFTSGESAAADADVVIVNQRLADHFWPGESALGHRLGVLDDAGATDWRRVVGVSPNLVYEEFGEETAQSRFIVYVPVARAGWRTMALLVRAAGDPAGLVSPARQVIRAADPNLAAFDALTMWQRRDLTQWGERFVARLFGLFGVTALLIASVGAYGVMAYGAGQRTREIGVRLALGARAGHVLWLVMRRGVLLTAIGVALGLPLAAATARAVQSMLFDVSPWSPAVWAGVPLALAVAILAASYLPARRASRIDPAVALRQE